jgi:hypothetical protein
LRQPSGVQRSAIAHYSAFGRPYTAPWAGEASFSAIFG